MITARLLRQKDAPNYLGISEPTFNKIVRPYVTVISEGRAVLYDRLDLDSWADKFKAANGTPGKQLEDQKWQNQHPVSEKKATYGTLTKQLPAGSFEKALEKRSLTRQKDT